MQARLGPPAGSSMSREAAIAFCALMLAFLAIAALITNSFESFLSYRPLPEEVFDASRHELLDTQNLCRGDWCDDIPSKWRDKATGRVFEREQFRDHRRSEALRLGTNWFLLGSIGAVMAAWYRHRFVHESFVGRLALFLGISAATGVVIVVRLL